MLALGAGMGVRRSEIAKLKLRDIKGNSITIRGKGHNGGKVVTRVMPAYVKESIEAYLPMREGIIAKYGDRSEGNLLVKPSRKPGSPMTSMDVSNMVLRLKRATGINFTCHSLRRLFAITVNSVTNLENLRQLMRHSSIEVTFLCYLNANPEIRDKALDEVNDILFGDEVDAQLSNGNRC